MMGVVHSPEDAMTSITITDPQLVSRWAGMRGVIELKAPDGECVGRVLTLWPRPAPLRPEHCFIDHVADPDLLAAFARVADPVEVRDRAGDRVGWFERTWAGKPPPGFRLPPPLSDEERAARRRLPGSGISLTEFWKRMAEGTWQ